MFLCVLGRKIAENRIYFRFMKNPNEYAIYHAGSCVIKLCLIPIPLSRPDGMSSAYIWKASGPERFPFPFFKYSTIL